MNLQKMWGSLTTATLLLGAATYSIHAGQKAATVTAALPEQAIHDYILAHPEVLLESIRQFQAHAQAEEKQKAKDTVAAHRKELQSEPDDPILEVPRQGTDPVTVVEFFDYRCGYCKKVDETVLHLTRQAGVRIVYKPFPILGQESLLAAKAALAANRQGAYNSFHHALITSATPVTQASVEAIAANLKLDVAKLRHDMESAAVRAEIDRNMALAGVLGVRSTPTFVIGDSLVQGAMTGEAMQSAVASARSEAKVADVRGGGQ